VRPDAAGIERLGDPIQARYAGRLQSSRPRLSAR
jgi:hypothetical protein